MWIIWALLAAVFSGVGVIFQKKIASTSKVLQTAAVNVVIVVITVFLAALMRGKLPELALISAKSWYLAAAAGLLQAASWIAYFLALRDANVSLFMVLDKTGIIFAMLMAALLLQEQITLVMLLGSAAILLGTGLMAAPRSGGSRIFSRENRWMLWALLSAFLTAATNIVIKLDASPVDVTVLTLVRMSVVAMCLCLFARIKEGPFCIFRMLGKRDRMLLFLGGAIMGLAYLCMYQALATGMASVVTAISRASFLVSTLLARIVFKERLSRKGVIGFCVVCLGVILFAV